MTKKFTLAVIGFVVTSFALAAPWHLIWFHDKYVAMGAFTRGEPIMPFGVLTMILQGVVFAYFYPLFYKHKGGGHPAYRGIQFSLFMGLTVWTVMVLATAAKFNIEPVVDFVILGTAFQILQFVFVGLTLGTIYGRNP
jgi:hypothetical protein